MTPAGCGRECVRGPGFRVHGAKLWRNGRHWDAESPGAPSQENPRLHTTRVSWGAHRTCSCALCRFFFSPSVPCCRRSRLLPPYGVLPSPRHSRVVAAWCLCAQATVTPSPQGRAGAAAGSQLALDSASIVGTFRPRLASQRACTPGDVMSMLLPVHDCQSTLSHCCPRWSGSRRHWTQLQCVPAASLPLPPNPICSACVAVDVLLLCALAVYAPRRRARPS